MMGRPHLARGSDISESAMLDLIPQDCGRPLSERCCTHGPALSQATQHSYPSPPTVSSPPTTFPTPS